MQRTLKTARFGAALLLGLALVTGTAAAWYPVATQAEFGTATW